MGKTHRQEFLNAGNVFAQVAQWQLVIACEAHEVAAVEEAFSDVAASLTSFEVRGRTDWEVTLYLEDMLSEKEIKAKLLGLKAKVGKQEAIIEKDWVSEVQKSFKPLAIGSFMVLGSHHKGIDTTAKSVIHLDAGCAFGTGEHATTSLCLEAIDWVLRRQPAISHALDVGTGSGILAIGFAKKARKPALAVDIDPVSVTVARENVERNGVATLVRCEAAKGCGHPVVKERAPYPLLLANILAKPLVQLAPEFAVHVESAGFVVLSGLLTWQERFVLHAYQLQRFTLVKRFRKEGWSALVLQK